MAAAEVNATSTNTGTDGTTSAYNSAQGVLAQIDDAKSALQNFVLGADPKLILENANKAMISMEGSALSLQRTMGGVVTGTDEFRDTLMDAYYKTVEIGASFKDITDAVEGLAGGMGRIVNPSAITLENMVDISKSTGIASKEIATMTTEFIRYGGTQDEALVTMHELANEARRMGINTAAYMKDVNANMKKLGGFGFKSGIEGLKQMSKQATMLRTTMDKIGAKGFADDLLDPEKAIQAAASMQMLGGAVGKLADPFQLMHMAQTDMAGLQEELIKSSKAAFTFNKATGGFDASTQDLYRLREQAKITGQNIDDMVESGREAAKLDYISSKFSLDGLSEEQQGIVASLAQIDKGGNVKIDIPGFDEQGKNLEELMKDANFKAKLDQYKVDSAKSEKEIAIEQMTISETQARDINVIKEAVIRSMDGTERKDFLKSIEEATLNTGKVSKEFATTAAPATATGVKELNEAAGSAVDAVTPDAADRVLFQEKLEDLKITYGSDMFFGSSGKAPQLMSEGTLYKGIVGDDVAIGTNLEAAFNQSGKLSEIMSSIMSTNNTGGGNPSVDGKIDININLTGAISGDKNSDIEKIFNSQQVQKQIMDIVLYKLESYKNQQGVLSK
jgi:hypothetical protein